MDPCLMKCYVSGLWNSIKVLCTHREFFKNTKKFIYKGNIIWPRVIFDGTVIEYLTGYSWKMQVLTFYSLGQNSHQGLTCHYNYQETLMPYKVFEPSPSLQASWSNSTHLASQRLCSSSPDCEQKLLAKLDSSSGCVHPSLLLLVLLLALHSINICA